MASKEKKKSDKKGVKKSSDNINRNKNETSSLNIDVHETVINFSEIPTSEDIPIPKEITPEPCYEEPTLAEIVIVARFEGEKVRGLYEGEGEAYFVNGHYYKGMFSEGYMHGIGVYVWSDGTVYQGEFLKNQITGKGKYIWQDCSTYVGDVLNGKRHGYGTFHSAENTRSYTGDWHHGLRHGKGRMEYDAGGGSYYDGDWVNGIKHGWGTRQYSSGNIYYGMWFNNVRHGEGTMKWLDRDQVYIGQWENGIQHGIGQHIWLLQRVHKTQYPMRNMYSGELVNGKRNGAGTFYYANGAMYEGHWKDNMKHGKGKFTFKNGRIYEGIFEKDHIVEYPEFIIDGTVSPDLSKIRTRTPIAADNLSIHSNESKNTISPSFQLDIDTLLATLPTEDREYEVKQVMCAITRHVSALHCIYTFYSTLGYQESPDNTFIMNKMQFWVFLKDISLHHSKYTLTDMDRLIGANYQKGNFELHNPYEKILQRQFVNYLIILAHLLYSKDYSENNETRPLLEYCFSRLIREKVLCNACKVKNSIYGEIRRAINILVHMDQAYDIYQAVSSPRKYPPKEPVLKMRQFLLLLKDLGMINQDLTAEAVIQVLGSDNPNVSDEDCYNLELEMTFLEFFEALLGCAERFVTEDVILDPSTPRPSTLQSFEPELSSETASLHQIQSKVEESESSKINTLPPSPGRQSIGGTLRSATVMINKAAESVAHLLKDESTEKQSISAIRSRMSGIAQSKETSVGQSRDSVVIGVEETQKTTSLINVESPKNRLNSYAPTHSVVSFRVPDEESLSKEELIEAEDINKDESFQLLDEATRKFNFWTHQIHIFFVRKFFPRAERYIEIKKLLESCRLEESKQRLTVSSETNASELPEKSESVLVDSKTEIAEGVNSEDIEQ